MKKWIFSIFLILSITFVFSCSGLFDLFDDEEEEQKEEQKIDYTQSITLSVFYSISDNALYLEWTNNSDSWIDSYNEGNVFIWLDGKYSGEYKKASLCSAKIKVEEGNHSVVLKNHSDASSVSAVDISNTISITVTKDTESNNTDNSTEESIKTPKEYWGTWIRMDTGNTLYISSTTNTKGYSLDGENVLKNGSTVYFRKGGSARDFSMTVSGFSDSRAARAISTGKQGISGRRQNKENSADTETVTSDSTGKIAFTGAVADDTQTITISTPNSTSETTVTESIEVTPQYNGENLGTIPLVEESTYGFKTTYSIDSDEQGFCFGSYYKSYTLKLNLNNIGSATCTTSEYEVSCSDKNLVFISGNQTGNFSSIESGKSKELTFTVRYGKIDTEYVDVPINISITDSKYQRTWEDSVTIRFYKGLVNLKVNARNFDESSSATLKGFLIYPDGRSKRFTVSHNSTTVVSVPWSESDYQLAFSGASSSNEMAYSFGFEAKTSLADLSGTWSAKDSTSEKYINAYEPNNGSTLASTITDFTKPVMAYLQAEDIDFYNINCSSIDVKFEQATSSSQTSSGTSSSTQGSSGSSSSSQSSTGTSSSSQTSYENTSSSQNSSGTSSGSQASTGNTTTAHSRTSSDITLSGSYSTSLRTFNLNWSNNSYDGNYVYIWVDSSYSGKRSFLSDLRNYSCTGYSEGEHSVVLKDGDSSSAIAISNTISITIPHSRTSSDITLSGSYSETLDAFDLQWTNINYDGDYVYIWIDGSYSGKTASISSLNNKTCTGYSEGTHSIVLKDGDSSSSIEISNTISIVNISTFSLQIDSYTNTSLNLSWNFNSGSKYKYDSVSYIYIYVDNALIDGFHKDNIYGGVWSWNKNNLDFSSGSHKVVLYATGSDWVGKIKASNTVDFTLQE